MDLSLALSSNADSPMLFTDDGTVTDVRLEQLLKASKEIANGDEIQFNNDIEIAKIAVDVQQKTGAQADFKASPLYDTAEYVTISPATGENKDYVGWTIVAIGILTTLASGVILVKRFVSKK